MSRILVIDDDEMALTIMRKLLEAERFKVDQATSAAEALARLPHEEYDAILCDMWMPGMNGRDFYREIRDRFPQYRNRLIFVTGDVASEATWSFIEERRLPYVLKPFNISELRRQLQEVLGELPGAKPIEGRRHRRIAIKANVRVREKRWATHGPEIAAVVNASKEGVFFVSDRPYRLGADLLVCFPYTGLTDIEQEGCVVRVEERSDGRYGVAIAMGQAAREARAKFLGELEDRRRARLSPLADTLVEVRPAADEDRELIELRKKMSLEREEARRIAEDLADMRETYERVTSQRDRLASEEAHLTTQLRDLLQAKAAMGKVIDDLQGQMTDLTGKLADGEEMRFQATHDSLTGVWNRGAVLDILARELVRAREEGIPVGVLLVDLDHFKSINDTWGHPAGDAVLVEAARRMSVSVRDYDSVGRYGGEEFMIVLPGCNAEATAEKAERIRASLAASEVLIAARSVAVTASLGAASSDEASESEALIRITDEALYRAKRAGRNRVERATPAGDGAAAVTQP